MKILIYIFSLGLLAVVGATGVFAAEQQNSTELAQALPPCGDQEALADFYNVPYPRQNSPALTSLIACINSHIPEPAMIDMGQIYTYQLNPALINYTRGVRVCGLDALCAPPNDCHAPYSCHYGGQTGTQGAEAVDYNAAGGYTENQLFSAIRTLVYPGGACHGLAKYIDLETDHTHLSTDSDVGCDATNIPGTAIISITPGPAVMPTLGPQSLPALNNPSKCPDAKCVVISITRIILGLIGTIALAMFIYGGIVIMLSAGNPERVKLGKNVIVYSSIGIVVIVLSWSIVSYLYNNILN